MYDCSYFLFELCRERDPYVPATRTDQEAQQRFAAAKQLADAFPAEYQRTLFELTDSMDALEYSKSHHAFLLGLDLGLSVAQALLPFQAPL